MMPPKAKKHLSQNFLTDRDILEGIAREADIQPGEWVLEIGPGRGALTQVLLDQGALVVAVEFDTELASLLEKQFAGEKKLTVIQGDILEKSFRQWLPEACKAFKIVANIPYAITAPIVQKVLTEEFRPQRATLLVQQEVARRLAGIEKERGVISVVAGYYAEIQLGPVVAKTYFDPMPKVESQVVTLIPQRVAVKSDREFFRIVKLGFQARRKKLTTNISLGLHIPKERVEEALLQIGKSKSARAQELEVGDWQQLSALLADNQDKENSVE